jgi:putative PIN family toxin of toxin-antitoxin system
MVVVDTNIILGALYSRNGASAIILRAMLSSEIEFAATPAIICEYEDVMKRMSMTSKYSWITLSEINLILDAICATTKHISPMFRFRPFLDDPKDDLFIECALASGASIIVTDDKHFNHPSVAGFGLKKMTAPKFVAYLKYSLSHIK